MTPARCHVTGCKREPAMHFVQSGRPVSLCPVHHKEMVRGKVEARAMVRGAA